MGVALALVAGVSLTSCGPGGGASLTIIDPVDGAVLNLGTDTRPDDGVQATIRVQAYRLAVGDRVDLLLDERIILGTQLVTESGDMTYEDVTLPGGAHTLIAATRAGDVRSPPIQITVNDGCPTVTFVTPSPMGERVTLGAADNTSGLGCDGAFETTVIVGTDAGDGQDARVFVNGNPSRTARVSGTTVTFTGVGLGNRGTVPNTISVAVTNRDGIECPQVALPVPVYVDCVGPSCEITRPSTGAFLNETHDLSATPGFQTDFDVTTNEDGVGQPIRLIIDGDESGARSAMPVAMGMGGVATFGNVGLSEGVHRVRAVCLDAAGNAGGSGSVEWTVDITPCALAITRPTAGELFIDADDLDDALEGIQIDAQGGAASDCDRLRVGLCPSIDTLTYGASTTDWTQRVTLGSGRNQEICAQALDAAGNTSSERVAIVLDTEAPRVEIVTPLSGAAFNRDGTSGRTADLDPASATCETAFTVNCTELGVDVTLLRQDTMTLLGGGTTQCTAVGGLPAPFLGQAVFTSVSLPSRADLTPVAVVARQESPRLVGLSDPVSFLSDCDPPVLLHFSPACGVTLRPGTADDSDPLRPGVQTRVRLRNPNVPKPPVELELRDSTGATIYGPVTSTEPAAGDVTEFNDVDFSVAGTIEIIGRARDLADNLREITCTVTVADIPTLSITQPAASAVLTAASDCDGARTGLQVRVRATTNAAEGSAATVRIGSTPAFATTASAGVIDVCIDAPEGTSLPVTVTVTDARGTAMATVTVTIDSLPPDTAISTFAPESPAVDRRGGIVRFTWTAVADQGGGALESYQVRCARTPIASEADWSAAQSRTVTTVPASAGTVQTADIQGFRAGVEYFCVLRGRDVGGELTPLSASAPPSATVPFLTTEWTATPTGTGQQVAAIGDVNGDGIDDVLVGSSGQGAHLFFGSATGLGTSPNVAILAPSGSVSFGSVVTGIGDFNGDGRPDFAVSDRLGSGSAGQVFILFGRASTSPWPATVDLGASCPGICLTGSDAAGRFGWDIASAGDFNGDGFMDLAVGAPAALTNGKVFIILGATTTGTFSVPSATPSTSIAAFEIAAPTGTRNFGISVASVGDLTTDGRAELIIGASGNAAAAVAGQVLRLDGRAYGAADSGVVTIASTDAVSLAMGGAGTFGAIVRPAGDVDGDAAGDLAVYEASSAGRVVVLLRRSGTYSLAASLDYTNDLASAASDSFGTTIATGSHAALGRIGDLDRDGQTDLLIGSSQRGTDVGSVDLFYTRTPAAARARSSADVILNPTTAVATTARRTGYYVGDVNGDGFSDFVVGDPTFNTGAGRVVVHY